MATIPQRLLAILPDFLAEFPQAFQEEGEAYFSETTHRMFYKSKNKEFSIYFPENGSFVQTDLEFDSKEDTLHYDCGCLLGNTRHCKHVVALALHIQQYLEEVEAERAAQKKSRTQTKKPSFAKIVKEMSADLTKEELLAFVMVNAKGDVAFQNKFLGHFMDKRAQSQSYLDLLQEWIASAMGRSSRLTERNGEKLIGPIKDLHKKAEKELKAGHWAEALKISMAMLVRLVPLLGTAQEKVGKKLVQICNKLVDLFESTIPSIKTPMQKEEWFEKIIEYVGLIGDYPSLKVNFLKAGLELALDDAMWLRLEEKIDSEIHEKKPYETHLGFVLLKQDLLQRRDRPTEIPKLLKAFQFNEEISLQLAQHYMEQGDFKALAKMATEKLKIASEKPYAIRYIEEWAKLMVSSGQHLEDRKMEMEGMLEWMIANQDIWNLDSYRKFRELVDPQQWAGFQDRLLKMKQLHYLPHGYYHVFTEIYFEKNDQNRLGKLLTQYGGDYELLSSTIPRLLPQSRTLAFRTLLSKIPSTILNRSFDPDHYFGTLLPLLKQQTGYKDFASKLRAKLQNDWQIKRYPIVQRFSQDEPPKNSDPKLF